MQKVPFYDENYVYKASNLMLSTNKAVYVEIISVAGIICAKCQNYSIYI